VRTLFVSGLPMDAKPRELYLLFRAYEGYEGSLLKVTSKNGKTASVSLSDLNWLLHINIIWFNVLQPVGFVTFNTRAGAEAAKQDLQVSLPLPLSKVDKHRFPLSRIITMWHRSFPMKYSFPTLPHTILDFRLISTQNTNNDPLI
jgi:hypothetical protein